MSPFDRFTKPLEPPKQGALPYPPPERKCATCRDMGYTIAAEWERGESIPAGVLFRYGRPCECSAGREFAENQRLWNLPILPSLTRRRIETEPAAPRSWPAPAWSDPPAPKEPRRATPRVTDEDIARLKAQQNASRKESGPQ